MARPIGTEMRITVLVEEGKVTAVKDQNNNDIPEVGAKVEGGIVEEVAEPLGGPREVAILKWHHHSPGCITLKVAGGGKYQICTS
jgi:hypothetical protein